MEKERTPAFSVMQAVKRRFFAMRNGDLAAQMAKGGIRYKINFGLNLPQIKEIAKMVKEGTLPDCPCKLSHPERIDLAQQLWRNDTTRESRLITPLLLYCDDIDLQNALDIIDDVRTTEEADVLCHSLLRLHFDSNEMVDIVLDTPEATDMHRYTALRLLLNLLMDRNFTADEARRRSEAEKARGCRLTAMLCHQIDEEADFREWDPA